MHFLTHDIPSATCDERLVKLPAHWPGKIRETSCTKRAPLRKFQLGTVTFRMPPEI